MMVVFYLLANNPGHFLSRVSIYMCSATHHFGCTGPYTDSLLVPLCFRTRFDLKWPLCWRHFSVKWMDKCTNIFASIQRLSEQESVRCINKHFYHRIEHTNNHFLHSKQTFPKQLVAYTLSQPNTGELYVGCFECVVDFQYTSSSAGHSCTCEPVWSYWSAFGFHCMNLALPQRSVMKRSLSGGSKMFGIPTTAGAGGSISQSEGK